jgi:hypothetical protein
MKLTRRWIVLLGLLASAAGLLAFSPPPKSSDVVTPTRVMRPTSNTQAAPTAAAEDTMILALRQRQRGAAPADAFALQNWTPPPPPPPPAPPPPKPTAPPLPFKVLGKKLEDGSWQIFLAENDSTYVVHAHDMIGATYRVESIAPPTAVLTYIPMNERQTLAIGNAE